MLPFSDFLILQEIKRTRPTLWEQMAAQGNPAAEGPPVQPIQMPQAPAQKPEDEEDQEETDASDEDDEKDEEEEDTRETDLQMLHNTIKQVKDPQIKNLLRQTVDKLKKSTPGKPVSQQEEPPVTKVPDQQQPPPQVGTSMQDPNATPPGAGGMAQPM